MTEGPGQPEGTGQGYPPANPQMPAPQAPPPPGAPQAPPPGYAPAPPQTPFPDQGGYQQPPVQAGWQPPPAQGGWQPPVAPGAPITPPTGGGGGGKKALIGVLIVVLILAAAGAGTYFYGKSSADDAAKKYETAYAAWKSGSGATILDEALKGVSTEALPSDDKDLTQAVLDKQKVACAQVKATAADLGSSKATPPSLESNTFSSLSSDYDAAKKLDTDRKKKFKDFTTAAQKQYQQFTVDCEWLQAYGAKILPYEEKMSAFDPSVSPESLEEIQVYITKYKESYVAAAKVLVETFATCSTTSLKPACEAYQSYANAVNDDAQGALNVIQQTVATGEAPPRTPSKATDADDALQAAIIKGFPGITDIDSDNDSPNYVLQWVAKHYVESIGDQVKTLKAL